MHNEGKTLESEPYLIEENTINNQSNTTKITHTFSYSKTLTDNSSFQEQKSISTTKSGSFNLGVTLSKVVAIGGNGSLNKGEQQVLKYGKNKTQISQITKNYSLNVQTRTNLKYEFVAMKASLDVPYIGTLIGKKTNKTKK